MALVGNTDRERRIMKLWAGAGIAIITAGLFMLNTTGAYNASGGNWFYTISVGGAEIVVAVAFGFTVLAQTWLRRVVCGLIFFLLLIACIENGKLAIKQSFSTVFVDTAEALEEKAAVAEAQALELDAQKVDVRANAGADLTRVREEIAELNLELALMSSSTRIKEAQTRLKALGEYTGPIDGLREELTEQAMLQRGETIRKRLAVLQEREAEGGTLTGVSLAVDPAAEKRIEAIRLRTQAGEVVYRTYWMHLILIALEGARSFGVWAFLMVSTVRKRQDVTEEVSDEVPAGQAHWYGSADDLDTMLSLHKRYKEQQENKKRQAQDKAPPGSPLRLDNKGWKREMKGRIQAAYDEGMSPQEIADHVGLTWPEYENIVTKMFNETARPKYLGTPDAVPDPRAAAPRTVGDYMPDEPAAQADSPQDEPEPDDADAAAPEEPEAEPEQEPEPEQPKEYGVSLYEAPANEEPEDKDEAA